MNRIKKIFVILSAFVIAATALYGCSEKVGKMEIKIGVLNGPTGIGAVSIMDKADNGEYPKYKFTLSPEVSDIVARLSNGDLQIGALPTNVAANLYNKTNGGVKIIAVNCLSVLYVIENGNDIKTPGDMKGKTVYVNGQGANPEFMLNYILRNAGLEPGEDVNIIFADPTEISAKMVSGEASLALLPVPAATAVMMKNPDVRVALDMGEEYKKASGDESELTMGCLVARKDFADENPDEIELFLDRYRKSIDFTNESVEDAAKLVAKYGITGNEKIAEKAIPEAAVVCITGNEVRKSLEGYLKVLYEADPKSVGGALPADDFYYEK